MEPAHHNKSEWPLSKQFLSVVIEVWRQHLQLTVSHGVSQVTAECIRDHSDFTPQAHDHSKTTPQDSEVTPKILVLMTFYVSYTPIEYHWNVHKSTFQKQTVILSPNFNMFHRILKKLASKAIVFYIVIYSKIWDMW